MHNGPATPTAAAEKDGEAQGTGKERGDGGVAGWIGPLWSLLMLFVFVVEVA